MPEEKTFEQYFEESLNEAEDELDGAGPQTGDENQDGENQNDQDGEPQEDTGNKDEDTEEDLEFEAAPEGESGDDSGTGQESQDEEDWKTLYEKERQRTKSWDGRLSAKDREIKELREEVEQLKQSQSSQSSGHDVESARQELDTQGQDGGSQEVLTEFFKEYPELQKPLETLVNKVTDEKTQALFKKTQEQIRPVQESVQEQTAEKHMQTIMDSHSDATEIAQSGQLQRWIDAQPDYISQSMNQVVQQGSAEQVVDLLNRFKKATGFGSGGQDKNTGQEQKRKGLDNRKRDASAVPGNSPGPPKEKARKEDFEGAWKEALREV